MRYLNYVEHMTDGILYDTMQEAVDAIPLEVIGTSHTHVHDTLEQGHHKWYEVFRASSLDAIEVTGLDAKPF